MGRIYAKHTTSTQCLPYEQNIDLRESLYSPLLKYGSYRSRDRKLRHRERQRSLGEAKFTARDHVALNIHKGIGYLACCCTLTSTADFCFLGKAPSQLFYSSFQGRFSRHLQVYQCSTYSYRSHSASPFPATHLFH